jgi:hypothetical protein
MVVATHISEYLPFANLRDEQRYFYAMQGWSGLAMAAALLWFCRSLTPLPRALLYLAAIWQGVQESLVAVCGTSLALSGLPYAQSTSYLCRQTITWEYWVIGICLALWIAAWKSSSKS